MSSIYGTDISDTPERDFYYDRGSDFRALVCQFCDSEKNPVDVSDWSFAVDLRERPTDDEAVLRCTFQNENLSTAGSALRFSVDAEEMESLQDGRYVYDLKVDAPHFSEPQYPVKGHVIVQTRISRS